MNGKPWTQRQLMRLTYLYPDTPAPAIAKLVRRPLMSVYQKAKQLGLKRDPAFVEQQRLLARERALTDPRLIAHRFKPGHVPPQKGKPFVLRGRMADGWFKPGQVSKRWDPEVYCVGALRITTDNVIEIRMAPGARQWKQLSHYVWFLHTGSWPPPGHVVRVRNGDPYDTQFENLELITQRENMLRNTFWNRYPPEVARLIQLKGAINRHVRRIERQGAHA